MIFEKKTRNCKPMSLRLHQQTLGGIARIVFYQKAYRKRASQSLFSSFCSLTATKSLWYLDTSYGFSLVIEQKSFKMPLRFN
jgi:hypothetical protein